MNKCRFFKELSSYLDNQLSEERKLEVQAHIHSCKLCSDELSGLKLLSERHLTLVQNLTTC
jgi:anti-sigma factor RsiW